MQSPTRAPVWVLSAVTVLLIRPSPPPLVSRSSCVTVWLAVYCQVSPAESWLSRLVSPTLKPPLVTAARLLTDGSDTVMPVSAVLPVLETVMV